MKYIIAILVSFSIVVGCINPKDVEKLSDDTRELYPIGEKNLWGFANSEGETVIQPIYEKVDLFQSGLALVKSGGKYGFIKKDGRWHLKAKYDSATSFFFDCSSVVIKNDSFCINRRGRKMNKKDCGPREGGGCRTFNRTDPNEFFKMSNDKYELTFKYYVILDSSHHFEVKDTSNLRIDEVIAFGRTHILLKKNGKYGLFDIWSHRRIIIDKGKNPDHEKEAHAQLSRLIEFKYDDVMINRFSDEVEQYVKVRIGNKYGVIDECGRVVLAAEYERLEIEPGWQMALVEYESDRFGYKKFNGKEFFKRKVNY